MKINSPIKLTLLLIAVMSVAGTASAYFAYHAGDQALKGINQPDINPTKKLKDVKRTSTKPVEFKPIDEKTILIKVYNHTHNKEKLSTDNKKKNQEEKKTSKSLDNNSSLENNAQNVANFPLKVEDGGISLAVDQAKNQGNSITLAVNLQNQGTEPIRFLYSFLEVTDDQGNSLSALTEGLPDELPPNSENFMGKIKIPASLVANSQTLSLNLTDYPDQKLELSLADIPIAR